MKRKITVLVVDDEADLREMVGDYLRRTRMRVQEAEDAASAWKKMEESRPDIVLLDWMLPDTDGLELLQKIRAKKRLRRVSVIMLTARADEQSRVTGLDMGADDYVVKPFSLRELCARIRAVLRRLEPLAEKGSSELSSEGVRLDVDCHKVFLNGKRAHLSPTEFRLLHFLMSHPDKVYSRNDLLNHVWGEMVVVEERTVDQHVRRLRKVLQEYGCSKKVITTVRGFGYQFNPHAH